MIGLLTHLNGAVATTLLCSLLFVDEAGIPLPFAPNELLLLVAGLLIASGVLVAPVALPAIAVFMTAGMLTGFSWARTLGSARLRRLAEKLHTERSFDRAVRRVRGANVGGLFVARLLPGVRPFATLAAGAADTRRTRFFAAAMPALVVWMGVLVVAGDLVGRPAERLLNRVEPVISTGVLLLVLGAGAFLILRHVPRDGTEDANRLSGLPRGAVHALALAIDLGVAGCLVAGGAGLGGRFVPFLHEPVGAALLAAVIVVGYLVLARRGAGATLGEAITGADLHAALGRKTPSTARRRRRRTPRRRQPAARVRLTGRRRRAPAQRASRR